MDRLLRGMIREGRIRVFLVNARKTSDEITSRHQTTPVVSAAIARLISVSLMMASMQKSGKLTIKVAGDGPIGMLVTDTNSDLEIRAFVENKNVNLPLKANGKLDVGQAVGKNGLIQVIKDLGLKQRFDSQVALQSGELGEDFSFYFRESEQVPSVVALGALIDIDHTIKAAGGMILQLMPDATEEDFVFAEEFAKKHPHISSLLEETPKVEALATTLFADIAFVETYPIRFKCSCRKERLLSSLAALSMHDLQELEAQKDKVEITCEFCNTHFYFDQQDIRQAIALHQENEARKEERI